MGKHNKAPSIRGRVSLPHDPRRQTDIILVFAEANSASARLAREAGVTYVGAAELFEPLLNGEINPTKVLCTPGMLSAVTGRLARFLGPKGLMPTARRGGVGEGEGLVERIQEARGAMDWKTNGWGVVRCGESPLIDPLARRRLISSCRASAICDFCSRGKRQDDYQIGQGWHVDDVQYVGG
jgi:large subunit ribosomal protein L1